MTVSARLSPRAGARWRPAARERICAEFESESWAGRLERIHQGPAAVADEPLVTVPVKFPRSMVAAIDGKTKNRSDFIRKAVAAAL